MTPDPCTKPHLSQNPKCILCAKWRSCLDPIGPTILEAITIARSATTEETISTKPSWDHFQKVPEPLRSVETGSTVEKFHEFSHLSSKSVRAKAQTEGEQAVSNVNFPGEEIGLVIFVDIACRTDTHGQHLENWGLDDSHRVAAQGRNSWDVKRILLSVHIITITQPQTDPRASKLTVLCATRSSFVLRESFQTSDCTNLRKTKDFLYHVRIGTFATISFCRRNKGKFG